MTDLMGFMKAGPLGRPSGLSTIAAMQHGKQDRYIEEDREQDKEAKMYAKSAVDAWSAGRQTAFQSALGKLSAINPDHATKLQTTFGELDKTNFNEAGYHIYNAALVEDLAAQDKSLERAKDVLGVRPDHPFVQGIDEILAMPVSNKDEIANRNSVIRNTLDMAAAWGAFGNYFQEERKLGQAGVSSDLREEELAQRKREFLLKIRTENRKEIEGLREHKLNWEREQRILNEGGIPEGLKKDPNDPNKFISVPGSPAYENRMKAKQKFIKAADSSVFKSDRLLRQINDAIGKADWTTTGVIGTLTKWIPQIDASNLKSAIVSIKANIGFDRLREMRENSPTGGALGQVAIQELEALQNSISSLDQSQDAATFKQNLSEVATNYARYMYLAKKEAEIAKKLNHDDFFAGIGSQDPGKAIQQVVRDKRNGNVWGVIFKDGTRERF